MIVLAGLATFIAGLVTASVFYANMFYTTSDEIKFKGLLVAAWLVAAIFWLAWWETPAYAHDHARPGLDSWYQSLNSGRGPCCDGPGVDATHLADNDWESKDGHYRVRIDGEWIDVPDEAVLKEPNKDGRTLVWPMKYMDGSTHIRCFIPGSMT